MNGHFKKRWTWVGLCWIAVAMMTFWNINKMNSIEKAMEKKAIYQMDEQFWNYNAANISQILKISASLSQEVESPKLGLFEFESNIRNLALKSGLSAVALTRKSQFEQDGIIPVTISFQGSFRQATNWFDNLEFNLPHAQVRDVKIELDEEARQNKFAVSIYYRYKQSAKESTL
jgi:hypothetical protein